MGKEVARCFVEGLALAGGQRGEEGFDLLRLHRRGAPAGRAARRHGLRLVALAVAASLLLATLAMVPLLGLQLVLCMALGYLLAVFAAALRDTTQIVTFALSVGIFLSPVLFPMTMFPADWRWVLGVNLWGVIHGVRAFVPRMLAHGDEAHVVNTASVSGLLTYGYDRLPYVTAKHAVVGMTKLAASELAAQH